MTPHPALVKVVQTCSACPSQWNAWDANGRYYYLRYRSGIGTVDTYDDPDWETWEDFPDGKVARFEFGDNLDGSITLEEFCEQAGLELAPDADVSEKLGPLLVVRIG